MCCTETVANSRMKSEGVYRNQDDQMQHKYSKGFVHHTCQTHAMHRASSYHTGHLLIQTCKHTYVIIRGLI